MGGKWKQRGARNENFYALSVSPTTNEPAISLIRDMSFKGLK